MSGEVRSEPNMIVHANNNIVSRSRGVSARPRTIARLCNNSQTGSDCRQLLTRRHRRCRWQQQTSAMSSLAATVESLDVCLLPRSWAKRRQKLWSKPKKMLTSFAVEAFSHQTTHWQARSERGSTSAAALTSPTTTSPASEAYYRSFASSVAVPVPSLLRKRFHRSSSLHILCAKTALQRECVFALERRSRCAPDCQTVTDLAWTLRCVWSQLKKQKSVLLCACEQMLCEGIGIIFWGEIIFFSVRSVAFRGKMWRETEIKITVALSKEKILNEQQHLDGVKLSQDQVQSYVLPIGSTPLQQPQ